MTGHIKIGGTTTAGEQRSWVFEDIEEAESVRDALTQVIDFTRSPQVPPFPGVDAEASISAAKEALERFLRDHPVEGHQAPISRHFSLGHHPKVKVEAGRPERAVADAIEVVEVELDRGREAIPDRIVDLLDEARNLLVSELGKCASADGESSHSSSVGQPTQRLTPYCPEHPSGSIFPCRGCWEARERREAWMTGRPLMTDLIGPMIDHYSEEVDHPSRGSASASPDPLGLTEPCDCPLCRTFALHAGS